MKRYLSLLLLLVMLCTIESCDKKDDNLKILRKAESCMSESPELALELLDAIDNHKFTRQKYHAKYALLYSMALDKNFIDVTNDSIIQPAVKYFRFHGKPTDKLLTYYYWGRIAMNAGDYETALKHFIKSGRYKNLTRDKLAVGRLYKAQAKVYQYCYDTHNMIITSKLAAVNYKQCHDTTRYINSLFDVVSGYMQQENTINALEYLDIIKSLWDHMSVKQQSAYFGSLLLNNDNGGADILQPILNQYFETVNLPDVIQWLPVAYAYYKLEDDRMAGSALESYVLYGGNKDAAYYWVDANVRKNLGDYQAAVESFYQYVELTGERNGYLFEADVRFLEERYKNELGILRRNLLIVFVSLCLMICALVIVVIFNRVRIIREEKRKLESEKNKYYSMYNSTRKEIKRLECTFQNNLFDESTKDRIVKRLNLLNKFLLAHITATYSRDAAEELKILLEDKDSFIESANLFFSLAHPRFFEYLRNLELTDMEIGYCCLYLMGLRGKDISSFMGNKHYKYSSNVRKKLGLTEHDTNLSIFLNKKFQEVIE